MNSAQRRKASRRFRYNVIVSLKGWDHKSEITDWLRVHKITDFKYMFSTWNFAKEKDAVFFKLKWV